MKFAFIREHRTCWPIGVMCRVLGVSRSGFFAWAKRPLSTLAQRREQLAAQVRLVHESHRKVYGSPRVHRVLRAQGLKVCLNTVAKVMRGAGIAAKKKRKFVPRTTDSSMTQHPAPNLLQRDFTPAPARAQPCWVSDITYIPTAEGWLYLAAVLDLGCRKIVGWAMDATMKTSLTLEAMRMALTRSSSLPGVKASSPLLHHSDRGVQYACDDYQQLLEQHGVQVSISNKGDPRNCYDNAPMESFWATLKTELVHQQHYDTHEQARGSIFEYIEVFYNRIRLHSTLGYVSPEAFEASLT